MFTRDEAIKILGENATEEQIKALLDKFHEKDSELRNKTNELAAITNELSQTKTDLSTAQQRLNDIDKANMTEQEKITAMKKEAEKNLDDSKLIKAEAEVTKRLATIGITNDELIKSMITPDIEASIKRADIYVDSFNAMKENTIKETTENLAKVDIKPTPSNTSQSDGVMTWEKFTQLSDVEQDKFQKEHPDEFDNL